MAIVTGQIDISVGSVLAVCVFAAGYLGRAGVPLLLLVPGTVLVGALLGAFNGVEPAGGRARRHPRAARLPRVLTLSGAFVELAATFHSPRFSQINANEASALSSW